jgi:hypothetical protein
LEQAAEIFHETSEFLTLSDRLRYGIRMFFRGLNGKARPQWTP